MFSDNYVAVLKLMYKLGNKQKYHATSKSLDFFFKSFDSKIWVPIKTMYLLKKVFGKKHLELNS